MWTSSSSIFYVSYNAKFLQVILAFKIKFYLLPVKLFEKSCHIYSYRAVHLKKCENNKITRIHIFVVETFLYNKYSIYGSPNVIWQFLKIKPFWSIRTVLYGKFNIPVSFCYHTKDFPRFTWKGVTSNWPCTTMDKCTGSRAANFTKKDIKTLFHWYLLGLTCHRCHDPMRIDWFSTAIQYYLTCVVVVIETRIEKVDFKASHRRAARSVAFC